MASKPKQIPRNATNAHIAEALNAVNQTLIAYGTDIRTLIDWKRGIEIAEKAVDSYKAKERAEADDADRRKYAKSRLDILKDLTPLIVALTVLAYAIAQYLSTHHK